MVATTSPSSTAISNCIEEKKKVLNQTPGRTEILVLAELVMADDTKKPCTGRALFAVS
jgi:hypothetical protein